MDHNINELHTILIEVKTKLENHLDHHETITRVFLGPILVIVVATCLMVGIKLVFKL